MLGRLVRTLFSRRAARTAPYVSGEAAAAIGDWHSAAAHWRQAYAADPRADAAARLSRALIETDALDEAAAILHTALERYPDSVEVRVAYADPLRYSGRISDAVRLLREAQRLSPDDAGVRRALLHLLPELCDWTSVREEARALREAIATRPDAEWTQHVAPIDALLLGLAPLERRAAAVEECRRMGIREPVIAPRAARAGERIRVGYVSGDFRDHAVAHLTESIFGLHTRDRFEIHAFSYGRDDASTYRQRIAETADAFHNLRGVADPVAAETIRRTGIDVLVDLSGHAPGNRLGILAHRPAPVQLHYLGYPGTTGAPFIDYFVTDSCAFHPAHRDEFTETFLVLPGSFLISNHATHGLRRDDRGAHGLPGDRFVFCNFGRNSRIDAAVFDVWMRILRAVPEGVLWLKHNNAEGTSNLQREAAKRDVDPNRLIFAADVADKAAHLARLAHADLFLDTFGRYNAHTTTADALWSGVPVLSTPSESFAGRVASSALHAAGLPELVAASVAEYERFAIALANAPAQLEMVRNKLTTARHSAPFFDAGHTVRALERAYEAAWRVHTRGGRPEDLVID